MEKGIRSERTLLLALAEMYLQGVSTRKVAAITEQLCGTRINAIQVSRAIKMLDENLELWRNRPLETIPYLILDARYEKVRQGSCERDADILNANCINSARRVLRKRRTHDFGRLIVLKRGRRAPEKLIARGLHGAILVISDDHAGLHAARKAFFTGIIWQRCLFHL